MRISFLISVLSGIILLISTTIFFYNFGSFNTKNKVIILFLMAISFSMHGIQHYYEEIYFDYNPLVGKWKINDDVQNK